MEWVVWGNSSAIMEISYWFIFSVVAIVTIFLLFRRDSKRSFLREYYYLKNYKFLADNPEVVISKKFWEGHYWISCREDDGKRLYSFFHTETQQKRALKNISAQLKPREIERLDVRAGARLREIP